MATNFLKVKMIPHINSQYLYFHYYFKLIIHFAAALGQVR